MKKIAIIAVSTITALLGFYAAATLARAQPGSVQVGNVQVDSALAVSALAADARTTKVVAAAQAFLGTLDEAQKKAASFAWTDGVQRKNWSNFPQGGAGVVRKGVRWGDLNATQRTALLSLLGAVMSSDGVRMAQEQMTADEIVKGSESGGPVSFGSDYYFVSFLGTPSATSPWMLQFGGHHLAINATVVGANITLAPSLTGGQPLKFSKDGKAVYIVEQEVKRAQVLLESLDAAQRGKVILGAKMVDLVLGPGKDGMKLQPEGLPGSAMNAAQKTKFLALIEARLNALNADDLAVKMTEVQKTLDQTYFAWYGPTAPEGAAYYRVTGPSVLIEFSPQADRGGGGDVTNHAHNMYRDPTNDYGAAWTK